jgi:hypothetical protein
METIVQVAACCALGFVLGATALDQTQRSEEE